MPGAMIIAWFSVLFVGLTVYSLLEPAICPPEEWISNTCFD
jgi:hypothetical protein